MPTRGANYARVPLDHYPTPPEVTRTLFQNVDLGPQIFDPACGEQNRIVAVALNSGKCAFGKDIITGNDFLTSPYRLDRGVDIVTNPPYGDRRGSLAVQFIERALWLMSKHRNRVAMLLPVDFDSAKTRQHVFGQHKAFAMKLILLDRIRWFDNKAGSTNHAWFIWNWKHSGPPTIRYTRIEK